MIESNDQEPAGRSPAWWIVIAPLVVMIVIFGFSSRSTLPDLDGGRGVQDIAGHFTVYAALGATLALLFRSLGWSAKRAFLVAVVIAILYGITDEFHQSFVPNRTVDAKDVLVDAIGAMTGAALMVWLFISLTTSATSDIDPTRPVDESSGRIPPGPPG